MEVLRDSGWEISEEVLGLVSFDLAIRYRVVPFSVMGDVLTLIVDEDFDDEKQEALGFILSRSILTIVVDGGLLSRAIDRYYKGVKGQGDLVVGGEEMCFSSEGRVVGIVNEGIRRGASDIHWEVGFYGRELVVRYRIDGEFIGDVIRLEGKLVLRIMGYIKLIAHMSIDQKRLPQDGRLSWDYYGRKYDLRVSSLMTVYGESLVMRILDREDLNLDINALGLCEGGMCRLRGLLEKPDGLMLITGPTGSGKTTTLYALLNFRSEFGDKVITVEDPVEYEFSNFSQISVSMDIGMSFSSALRAMLRQSPDVIMIGEIRDSETAQIVVNAALTGHLVFSTLHTNDTLSAILRLLDLGVRPYQISAVLRGIVAQRLVRRLCCFCKESYIPSEGELGLLDLSLGEGGEFIYFRSKGCEHCRYTGFKGRLGLFEVLPLEGGLSGLIYDGASYQDLEDYVRTLEFRTLKQSGVEKIMKGLTTIEEVVASLITA